MNKIIRKFISFFMLIAIVFLTQPICAMEDLRQGTKRKDHPAQTQGDEPLNPSTKKREVIPITLEEATLTLEDLPNEIIIGHIFPFLTHKEIVLSFSLLNNKYHILSKDSSLWRKTVIAGPADVKKAVTAFKYFLHSTQKNPTLSIQHLQITGQNISSGEWKTLGNWLFSNQHLQSLSLLNCGLQNADASFMQELKGWLASHKTLEELDLTGNLLEYYGTATIIEALRGNKSLKKLILDSTYKRDRMFSETFSEDLKANNTLIEFSFRKNPIGEMAMDGIIDDLQSSTSLLEIDFEGTPYPSHRSKDIEAVLKRNIANKTK